MTGEPRHVPMLLADKSTGLAVVYAVTMALLHRERTGRGQEVDVSMFEHMVHFNLVEHLFGAPFQPPVGDFGYTRLQAPDRGPIDVRDGYIGRATCGERVRQYGQISGGAGSFKNTQN